MKNLFLLSLILLTNFCFAQKSIIIKTKNLHQVDTTLVFTPKNIKANEKVPAIILLHGYTGNHKNWNDKINAQKYADDYGFVVICPDGLYQSWYINSPAKADSQYEDFFFDELMPRVKSEFPVDERNIFITGLSMGGHGALWLFLQKPDMFRSAGSTSGGINLHDAYGKFGVPELLGNPEKGADIWNKYSVTANIERLRGSEKAIIFDCGVDDFFYKSNNELKRICDELKIKATYISQPGGHSWPYWQNSINQHFAFFKTQIVK